MAYRPIKASTSRKVLALQGGSSNVDVLASPNTKPMRFDPPAKQ